ncbi:MAG: phospholipid carrier-dependent glycosyltransferase [Desulfobacteraceae bacterium]|nr:phospholipid carrier-dependent glycosyltransferase [Desulfobacteraceae bacterium]
MLFTLVSTIAIMSAVPPVSRDALTHHLAVPRLYVQAGNIHELPDIVPSYYPQLLDLIYCIPLIFGNDIIPKYIHFAFALFTAFLIFLYLQKELNRFYGMLSVLFFLSLPVIVKLSITVYVDLGLIFFSFASLICLLKWYDKKFHLRWLFLAALCCALASSTKYNGLITCFILTALTPFLYLKGISTTTNQSLENITVPSARQKKYPQLKAAGYGICFLLISTAIFSPWMIKNYVWTKNLIYPLYDNYFNSKSKIISKNHATKPAMNHFLIRKYIYGESLLETITIPLRIFFQGEDDNPKFFDGQLNPLLFLLPLFAFISIKKKTEQNLIHQKTLLAFSLLYIMIVFFHQDMRIRWIGPAIPPLIILSAHGLKNIFQLMTTTKKLPPKKHLYLSWIKKSILFILIFSMASLNAVYIYQLFKKIAPQTYITHKITRSEYIEQFRPEYATLQFSNQHLKGNIKLLAFFLGNRRYYSTHDIIFNNELFQKIIQESKTPKQIFQNLKIKKFTHLLINYPKFNSWININFDTREKEKIQKFFNKYTKILFLKNNHGLYQLKQ